MDMKDKNLEIQPVQSQQHGTVLELNELTQQYGQTQRGLKPRHVQLMAIGGSIGTALWVGYSSNFVNDQN